MADVYKIYQGNRGLLPLKPAPLIFIVAQTDGAGNAFSEHYIFTGLDKPPFLKDSSSYSNGRNVSPQEFAEIFTLETLCKVELNRAKAHLEHSVFTQDRELHKSVFLGAPLEFAEADDSAFINLGLKKCNKAHIADMFSSSESNALDPLEKIWTIISRMAN